MRGGILTPSVSHSSGGVAVAVRALVHALERKPGIDVRVFCLADAADTDEPSIRNLRAHRVRGPKALGYAPELLPAVRAADLDFVHVHGLWMYPSWAALRVSEEKGTPNMISPHGMLDPWALQRSRWKKRLVSALYEQRHLRRARCLHALCDSELNSIRACGLDNPVCVIPNGVSLPEPKLRESPWKHIPADKKVCLFLGRIHPKKGVDLLVQAWNQMPAPQRADWHLAIAGWGPAHFTSILENSIKTSPEVHFLGPMFGEQKAAAFQHASAFILPSFSEGVPMAILEAWSHAKPVIMTPACNLPIGFEEGAAHAIDPTVAGIRRGLAFMTATSDADRKEMGCRGHHLVCQHFTWEEVAERFLEVYHWLANGASRPSCIAA